MSHYNADFRSRTPATSTVMRPRKYKHKILAPEPGSTKALYFGCIFALIAHGTGKKKDDLSKIWGRQWVSPNGSNLPKHTYFTPKTLGVLEELNPSAYNLKGVKDVLEAFAAGNSHYADLFSPEIQNLINNALTLADAQNKKDQIRSTFVANSVCQHIFKKEHGTKVPAKTDVSIVLPESPMPVSVENLKEAVAQEQYLQGIDDPEKWRKLDMYTRKAIVHEAALKLSPRNEEQCARWIACCTEMTSQLGRPLAGKAPSVEQVRTHFGNLYAELTADQRKAPFGRRISNMIRFAPK